MPLPASVSVDAGCGASSETSGRELPGARLMSASTTMALATACGCVGGWVWGVSMCVCLRVCLCACQVRDCARA